MDYPLEHTIDEAQQVCIKPIKAASLFKVTASATFSFFVPLMLFLGVLALFGAKTIRVNFEPVVGVRGLLASMVMGPLFAAIAAVAIWIALYVGILIYGCFAPLTIAYVPADKPKDSATSGRGRA